MDGEPIKAAKNSSAIVIDLIKIWGRSDLFPDQIGNIQFQYIQFGGKGQQKILHPLGKITDIDKLRNDIVNAATRYSSTDFTMGMEPVVQSVADSLDHKTIFLTDGQDQSVGPNKTPGYYSSLDEVKFVVYGQPNISVDQKGWLSIVKDTEEFHVNDEYEVFAVFVKTLFEFVDNINKYLVRQGDQRIEQNIPFEITKHSGNQSHLSILSVPRSATGLKIDNITDSSGSPLATSDYIVYETKTFLSIVLNPNVATGDYKVNFIPSSLNRSHSISYINFEQVNIALKLFTTPDVTNGCYLENSSVNFKFKYWDLDLDKEVAYPDFLSHSAYRYKLLNDRIDVTGKGDKGLLFSHAFDFGSAGNYEIRSAWSYNEEKLKNDDPPLSVVGNICVSRNGSLVRLKYDTTLTWEGREIEFTATIEDQNPIIAQQNKKLVLDLGNGSNLDLIQDSSNPRTYRGTLDYVERGRDYTLSIKNINSNFNFALDQSSNTTFYGKERTLKITYRGKDFSSLKRNYNPDSFIDKLRYAFSPSASDLPDSSYTYQGDNLIIPYEIPYYSALNDEVQFQISINKVFPDEEIKIDFLIDSQANEYPFPDTRVIALPFWPFSGMGWPKYSQSKSSAISFRFPQQKGSATTNNIASNNLIINKLEGAMDIEVPLYPEPKFTAEGNIEFKKRSGKRQSIRVPTNTTIIEIKTNQLDRMATLWRWWATRALVIIIALLIIALYLFPYLASVRKSRQKVRVWRRLLYNDHLRPEDLWNSPEMNQKCNPDLALPSEIRALFRDLHSMESRKEFETWIKEILAIDAQDPKKANRLIKKKIGYQSLFINAPTTIKPLLWILFPFIKLIDFWRAALQLDRKAIKNARLIEYVRTVEDINTPNVPSTFSFTGQSIINVTFSDRSDNNVRLRDIKAQGKIAEITLNTDYVTIQSKNFALKILWPTGEDTYASYNDRTSSPRGITGFEFEVEDRLFVRVTDIDFERRACVIATNRS